MIFRVTGPFKVKTSQGEKELQAGQIVILSTDKALKLLNEGKIAPTERAIFKVFSEILQASLLVVYGSEDGAALRAHGVAEVIYTDREISELKKLPKDDLRTMHEAKEVFPSASVEEVVNRSEAQRRRLI